MKRAAGILLVLMLVIGASSAQNDDAQTWNDRVFYEIFVRSFYDSDGDGIGDLQGVIEKLDYLNDGDPTTTTDLGITGIWLMPIMEAASYHGYDVTDYYTVEQDYGTNEDLRELVDAAHERGIAVILDLVLNHTSNQHPWFIESANDPTSKYANYYLWSDDNPGYQGPNNQQVWHPYGDRYYYGLFWEGMPDLNYTNPLVSEAMYDVTRFWLNDMGVDGFRLDAAKHIIEEGERQEHTSATRAWLENYMHFVHTVKPSALVVGEVWSSSMIASEYIPEALDLVFEFDLASTMVDGVRRRSNSAIRAVQDQVIGYYPPGQYATFLTNHDQDRTMSEFDDDVGSAKVAATVLLTSPGVPFIYYGEEIGMMGEKPDERIRTPMQWSAEPDTADFTSGRPWEVLDKSYDIYNVAAETDDPDSLLNHYRSLIHLRAEHPALMYGDWTLVESSERPIYSFIRHTDDETLLIVINLNHREIDDYTLSLAEGMLNGVTSVGMLYGEGEFSAPEINASGGFDAYKPLDVLPPRSSWIVKLG